MQAIIITAYKDQEQLKRIITDFNDEVLVLIHIDKKSKLSAEAFKELNYSNLVVLKKYNVSWGSYNHLLAVLDLFKIAIIDERVSYIHVISGQDMMTIPLKNFKYRFEEDKNVYMTCTDMENFDAEIRNRYQKGIFSSKVDIRMKIVKKINRIYQIKSKITNNIGEYTEIFKGMIWVSMPKEGGNYVINYIANHREYMYSLKHVICPEEFFFQTIIMNSIYKKDVVRRNLRYTDWNCRNGSCPAILDETDYDKIFDGDYVFARKIDSDISCRLITMIEQRKKN